ncbi:uncharacterized protein FTOL_13798 [Fusarium torulosum]|uniref:Uncharacterized protein n=1 Tax=Fusarium torulosum TaxID=33205 RepID=A0AAE8MMS1_9HYPO|nr:uncharacterized protein FTOL_13798 [Fusarium torulosum]
MNGMRLFFFLQAFQGASSLNDRASVNETAKAAGEVSASTVHT